MKTLTSRLLVIDRDREFLQAFRSSLSRGCFVDTAETVLEARQKLSTTEFEIIIAELPLLESDDYRLLEWVRLHYPTSIGMVLVAEDTIPGILEGLSESTFDYLTKPLDTTECAYRIKRALEYRQMAISAAESRAKDRFLAAVSHELRTPLTAITGAVRLLQSPGVPPDRTQSVLDLLARNAKTLRRLLDDLLDSSRIASGKLTVDLTPTNVNECVAAAVETMRSKANEAGVELQAFYSPDPMTVHGNGLRLQQIAWNLIDNAIKFTPAGGEIAVSVSRSRENVEVVVCDTGVGLSDDDLKRIFEPFEQAHESDQKKGGLGLGLALVRSLTEMHNGTVRAESDGIGRGASFIVTLPLAANPCTVHTVA
jgi:signal transduction histidine kinase